MEKLYHQKQVWSAQLTLAQTYYGGIEMGKFVDTTELRKLILENPELPLLVCCNSDCDTGDYGYTITNSVHACIAELGIIDNMYISKEEYKEELEGIMYYSSDYETMTTEEIDKVIDEKFKETIFTKCIIVEVD